MMVLVIQTLADLFDTLAMILENLLDLVVMLILQLVNEPVLFVNGGLHLLLDDTDHALHVALAIHGLHGDLVITRIQAIVHGAGFRHDVEGLAGVFGVDDDDLGIGVRRMHGDGQRDLGGIEGFAVLVDETVETGVHPEAELVQSVVGHVLDAGNGAVVQDAEEQIAALTVKKGIQCLLVLGKTRGAGGFMDEQSGKDGDALEFYDVTFGKGNLFTNDPLRGELHYLLVESERLDAGG